MATGSSLIIIDGNKILSIDSFECKSSIVYSEREIVSFLLCMPFFLRHSQEPSNGGGALFRQALAKTFGSFKSKNGIVLELVQSVSLNFHWDGYLYIVHARRTIHI